MVYDAKSTEQKVHCRLAWGTRPIFNASSWKWVDNNMNIDKDVDSDVNLGGNDFIPLGEDGRLSRSKSWGASACLALLVEPSTC